MVKLTKPNEIGTKLDSLKAKLDTLSVEELKKELESIVRSLPKEEKTEKKVEKQKEAVEEVSVKPVNLEQVIDIPVRPINSGLQTVPHVVYEKKDAREVPGINYSDLGGYHLGSSEGYLMAELNTGQFTLDMNAAVRLPDNGNNSSTFTSIEQRNRAREKARKLMPWASEEDLMKYEGKLIGKA